MNINAAILPDDCFRQSALTPKGIVVHYFSAIAVERDNPFDPGACRQLFIDINREASARQVYSLNGWPGIERSYASAHVMICRDEHLGVWRLVPENRQAYHAGRSEFKGVRNWNAHSLGIELLGTATSGFEVFQYEACAALCAYWMKLYDIPIDMVVGHEEVSPGRKVDPGIATGNFKMTEMKNMIVEILQDD